MLSYFEMHGVPVACSNLVALQCVHFGHLHIWLLPVGVGSKCKTLLQSQARFFLLNPPIKGDIVFLLFGMAVGEPPRQDPGGTKGCALQSRGAERALCRGRLH